MKKNVKRQQKRANYNRYFIYALQMLVIFSLWHCPKGKPPVSELSLARLHLSAAQEEGGHSHDPESYNQARDSLLKAHEFLVDEKFSDAKEQAERSSSLSIALREQILPGYLSDLDKQAQESIDSLSKRNAAKIVPDDFEALQVNYHKAKAYQKKGDIVKQEQVSNSKEGASDERSQALRNQSIGQYRNAYLVYRQVLAKSREVEKAVQAQSLSLAEMLKTAEANIQKARLYGAPADRLAKPQSDLTQAKKHYQTKRHDEASRILEELNRELAALIAEFKPAYAQKMLTKAKASISKAEKLQEGADTPQNRQDPKKANSLAALKDQLAAAKEAQEAAASFLEQENYDESIEESEDAIRLSQVILEQGGLIAANRNVVITNDGYGMVEDIGNGWKRYTVRNKKPADCLWCISARSEVYGNGYLWRRIYKANRKKIKNANWIYPGQTLFIPPKEGTFSEPPQSQSTKPSPSSTQE